MTVQTTSATEAVFNQHLQAILASDLDAIVRDYADDAVLFMPTGTFKGLDQIRAAFAAVLTLFTPEVKAAMTVHHQQADGEFFYLLWSAAPHITLACDTFCVRDGKIVMQSFVGAGPLFG